jgi:hypothetical protein
MLSTSLITVQTLLFPNLLPEKAEVKIYNRKITLPVVLYGCEKWSLALRDQNRFKVSEDKVRRRLFQHKKDCVTQ